MAAAAWAQPHSNVNIPDTRRLLIGACASWGVVRMQDAARIGLSMGCVVCAARRALKLRASTSLQLHCSVSSVLLLLPVCLHFDIPSTQHLAAVPTGSYPAMARSHHVAVTSASSASGESTANDSVA